MDMDTLDKKIEQILTKTSGDDEVFRVFVQLLEDNVRLPADGFVIGEPISVTAIEYTGNARRGLTAGIRREDGSDHVIALSEVMFPRVFAGGQVIAGYRKWLGLDPLCAEDQVASQPGRHHKATGDDIDLSKSVELVILSVKELTARCRLLDSDRIITLRAAAVYDEVPGNIVTVTPKKQWRYGGHPYLSGEIESARLDVQALKLVPLGLADMGIWDPREHDWGEEDEPLAEWARPIMDMGTRPMFEMEQVLPGGSPGDPFNDPICQAADFMHAGEKAEARQILMDLCQADLRCMQGYGLCLWRLGRFGEAERIFNRMLWLNPSDNQGARFLLDEVKAGITWENSENRE